MEKVYRRRRLIAAVAVALFAIGTAAGIGVALQKATGWTEEEWAAHTSVREPADYAPATAVAIQEPEPTMPSATPTLRESKDPRPVQNAPGPGETKSVTIETSGVLRSFLLSAPVGVETLEGTGEPRPLILAFHGYTESPESMSRYTGLTKDGAIVAYPKGIGEAWEGAPYSKTDGGQDVRFATDLLERISATYRVDANRIYAAGMSNGGGFVAKLACEVPEEFSAMASVAGAYYPGTWRGCTGPTGGGKGESSQPAGSGPEFARGPSVPFLEIHGRQDETIEYDGGHRHGSTYLGAMQFSSLYASRSGCFGAPSTTRATDKVLRVVWPGCDDDAEVTHLAIADAGHTWPGESTGEAGAASGDDFSDRRSNAVTATNEIMAFFNRHQIT